MAVWLAVGGLAGGWGACYCARMLTVAGVVLVPVALLALTVKLMGVVGADGNVPVIWHE